MEIKSKIIGIYGKAGSGKDTFADAVIKEMINEYNSDTVKKAFADNVKKIAAMAFQIPIEWFYERDKKEMNIAKHDLSPRKMAQLVGTEMFRNLVSQDFWVNSLERELLVDTISARNKFFPEYVIVTDVRFKNELDWVKKNKGIVVHVVREKIEQVGFSNHASEQDLELLNHNVWLVRNDGSLEDLAHSAKVFARYAVKML